jgi:hypothetical protein
VIKLAETVTRIMALSSHPSKKLMATNKEDIGKQQICETSQKDYEIADKNAIVGS